MTGGGRGGRRGEDPEGGERSAWKGLVGPSGLNLDHSQIPGIEKKVYDTLLPLVFKPEQPIPLSQFSQAACDVLLPVLPRQAKGLDEHSFKSQWGRLNEYVCPKLAQLRGLGDCGFNRQQKTVHLSIATDPPPGFTPTASRAVLAGEEEGEGGQRRRRERSGRGGRSAMAGAAGSAAAEGADAYVQRVAQALAAGSAADTGSPAAAAAAQPAAPLPVPLAATSAPVVAQAAAPAASQAGPCQLCLYCGQGYHVVKQCPDFHAMLQSIYSAGYQQGVAAAQQAQQAAPPQTTLPPPAPYIAPAPVVTTQYATALMPSQQLQPQQPAVVHYLSGQR